MKKAERFKYVSVSQTGKKRKTNEDSVGIFRTELGLLFIVCDGLGGGLSGEFASLQTMKKIYNYFITSNVKDILLRIRTAVENANLFIYQKSNGNLSFKGMASTCELLLLNSASFYWAHVGDSRLYIFHNKKLKQLTKDHSIVQELMDEGKIKFGQVKKDHRINVVSKAIGDLETPSIDTSKMILPTKHPYKFFICTDGVTAVIRDGELEDLLSSNDLQETSSRLQNIIERRGSPDNYSFVIVSP